MRIGVKVTEILGAGIIYNAHLSFYSSLFSAHLLFTMYKPCTYVHQSTDMTRETETLYRDSLEGIAFQEERILVRFTIFPHRFVLYEKFQVCFGNSQIYKSENTCYQDY